MNKFMLPPKTTIVMVAVISLWIYAAVTLEFTKALDIPMPVMAIILAVLVVGAYKYMEKTDTKAFGPTKAYTDRQLFILTFVSMAIGLVVAVVGSLATIALTDADYRREFGALVTTCDKGKLESVKTIPMNKSIELKDGTKLTIKNVTYNVPQDSERPLETNAYYCSKATLVEFTADNLKSDVINELSYSDISIISEKASVGGKNTDITAESDLDDYAQYADQNNLKSLRLSYLAEGTTSSTGWLAFAVSENSPNRSVTLIVSDSDDSKKTIDLPDYK